MVESKLHGRAGAVVDHDGRAGAVTLVDEVLV